MNKILCEISRLVTNITELSYILREHHFLNRLFAITGPFSLETTRRKRVGSISTSDKTAQNNVLSIHPNDPQNFDAKREVFFHMIHQNYANLPSQKVLLLPLIIVLLKEAWSLGKYTSPSMDHSSQLMIVNQWTARQITHLLSGNDSPPSFMCVSSSLQHVQSFPRTSHGQKVHQYRASL